MSLLPLPKKSTVSSYCTANKPSFGPRRKLHLIRICLLKRWNALSRRYANLVSIFITTGFRRDRFQMGPLLILKYASKGIWRRGVSSFCKKFLCFNTMPCRHMPLLVHSWLIGLHTSGFPLPRERCPRSAPSSATAGGESRPRPRDFRSRGSVPVFSPVVMNKPGWFCQ